MGRWFWPLRPSLPLVSTRERLWGFPSFPYLGDVGDARTWWMGWRVG